MRTELATISTRLRAGSTVGLLIVFAALLGLTAPGVAATRSSVMVVSGHTTADHVRFVALAGSSRYLVYEKATTGQELGEGSDVVGNIYVTRGHGKPRLLASSTGSGTAYLAGSMVIVPSSSAWVVRWWNLADGRHGSAPYPQDDQVVAASPRGWVLTRTSDPNGEPPGITDVLSVTTTGKVTNLGHPYAAGAAVIVVGNGKWLVTSTPDGDDFPNNGTIREMGWGHPGHFATVYSTVRNAFNKCTAVSANYAACVMFNTLNRATLVPLTPGHKRLRTTRGCAGQPPAILAGSLAWITSDPTSPCATNHLKVLRRGGTIRTSTRAFNIARPVAALHALIVSPQSQRRLESITSANATPKTVVG